MLSPRNSLASFSESASVEQEQDANSALTDLDKGYTLFLKIKKYLQVIVKLMFFYGTWTFRPFAGSSLYRFVPRQFVPKPVRPLVSSSPCLSSSPRRFVPLPVRPLKSGDESVKK